MKVGFLGIAVAIALNLAAWLLRLDYLWTVLFVMGGMGAWFGLRARKVTREQWILVVVFSLFSAVMTTIIEQFMLHYDIWGFSRRHFRLIGITFLGAPIEEYIYWYLCPVLVALAYLVMGRVPIKAAKQKLLAEGAAAATAKVGTEIVEEVAPKLAQGVHYVEDDPAAVIEDAGKYARGLRFPGYVWLQVAIVGGIVLLWRHYRGNWKSLIWATILFIAVAYPNELLGLHNGFWTYNTQRLLGPWILGVPIEEWAMYTICPICSCMLLDFMDRILFHKDL